MKPDSTPVFRLRVSTAGSSILEPMADDGVVPLLVIEHRDEVFARLAADLRCFGCEVERAASVDAALSFCRVQRVALTLCNRDIPEESGWLIASKLRLLDPLAKIWLYAARFASFDQVGAQYSGVEDLVYYNGDLISLSKQLSARLWNYQNRLRRGAVRVPQEPADHADAHIQLERSLRAFLSAA